MSQADGARRRSPPESRIIQLRNVSKTYAAAGGRFTALDRIELEFSAGEHVAIVGKSGSGKSTLLNMLTGIDHPTTGTVVIDGVDVHRLDESRLARWRGKTVGIVFQFFQLIPTLSILENVLLAMDFVGVVPAKERGRRAGMLLEEVDIARHADKLPSALSGGEQQRAAIARALANDPQILVADEPTGNLDSHAAEAIQHLLARLAQAGRTVIVVTHDQDAGTRFERSVSLADGRVESDRRRSAQPQGAPG